MVSRIITTACRREHSPDGVAEVTVGEEGGTDPTEIEPEEREGVERELGRAISIYKENIQKQN